MTMTMKELNDVLNLIDTKKLIEIRVKIDNIIVERNNEKLKKIAEFQERLDELIDEIECEGLKVNTDCDGVITVIDS